jgi:predicted alpha/beta-fold hydrolase
MKKAITFFIAVFICAASFGQTKQDTTIVITMPLDQFRAVLYTIDQNIDSKKVSKELLEFLQKSAAIKPKEIEPKKK